jgi:hypothetical protein
MSLASIVDEMLGLAPVLDFAKVRPIANCRGASGLRFAPQSLALAAQETVMAKKYGNAAEKTVESAMRRRKKGTLKSGSGRRVTSRKQAIAIGLSEARKKGAKVPRKTAKRTSKSD